MSRELKYAGLLSYIAALPDGEDSLCNHGTDRLSAQLRDDLVDYIIELEGEAQKLSDRLVLVCFWGGLALLWAVFT